jgi:hypothetical protein
MKNKILILYIPVNISQVYKCKIYKIGIIKKNTSNGIKKTNINIKHIHKNMIDNQLLTITMKYFIVVIST